MSISRRIDGRHHGKTLRPLSCEISCLHHADGSALWKSGSTHVLAAVYGPVAPLITTKELEACARVSVIIKSQSQSSAEIECEWNRAITEALSSCIDRSRFPRMAIEINLQIVQSDGSVLSCLLHAAVAALVDAGIDMLYMPVATTFLLGSSQCSSPSFSKILLDPVQREEHDGSTIIVIICSTESHGAMLGCHVSGSGTSVESFLLCQKMAHHASLPVKEFWRLAVQHKAERESQTLLAG